MPAKLIYAKSNDCADLLYATGFMACDPFIYFSADDTEAIVVSALEQGRAVKEAKPGIKVFEIIDIMGPENPMPLVKDIILKITELFPRNQWLVPASFPFCLGQFLKEQNIDILCLESYYFPTREIKKEQEIMALQNALLLAEKAMQKAADLISQSKIDAAGHLLYNREILTSEIIKTEIGIEIIRGGGVADHTIVACGKHGADPHHTGNGPLYADQPIVVDIFPRVLTPLNREIMPGYWGDITRTFVKGKASPVVKDAYRAVTLARNECQNMIKEGVIASEVHTFAERILDDCGFKTEKIAGVNRGFFHGLGHGVGLEIHEAPSVSLRNSQPLQAGNVITVEPGIYYPEWGGIRLENMAVVQKNDCRVLTEFPDFLEIE